MGKIISRYKTVFEFVITEKSQYPWTNEQLKTFKLDSWINDLIDLGIYKREIESEEHKKRKEQEHLEKRLNKIEVKSKRLKRLRLN